MQDGLFKAVKITREQLVPGIIIRMFASDGTTHGFNDSLVFSVTDENVVLVRPYARIESGVVKVMSETFPVPTESLLKYYHGVYEGTKLARLMYGEIPSLPATL